MPLDDLVYRQRGAPVHHSMPACPDGRSIPDDQRVYDAGTVPLCSECKRLERGGGATPGGTSRL